MIKGVNNNFDDFGIWGVEGIKKFIYEIEKVFSKLLFYQELYGTMYFNQKINYSFCKFFFYK